MNTMKTITIGGKAVEVSKYEKAGMIDGRPWSDLNDTKLLTDMLPEEQKKILEWIKTKLIPRKTINPYYTSYGIKHILQSDIGIYMTNNQFKDAMLICGYKPYCETDLNWNYGISQKSPAFKI